MPQRVAFIARNAGALAGGGMRRIEYIQVMEHAPDPHRFNMWDLGVDCNASRFGAPGAQPLACTEGQPPAEAAMFVGHAYRAPDMLHHFRSVFWASER